MSTQVIIKTIDDVIREMNQVVDRCIREKSKIGYFAVLYRDVTIQVKNKIQDGNYFEDGKRMERLDVVFAERFLNAINQYWSHDQPSKSWLIAFDTSKAKSPIILQHLLMGMNAHINLDLAIATAQVAPGYLLPAIEGDFQKIMDLLSSMIDEVQERIELVSPAIKLIDKFGGRTDEKIAGFVIKKARDLSWSTAEKLAIETPTEFALSYALHDDVVSLVGKYIANPGLFLTIGIWLVRIRESKDVVKVIKALEMK